MPKRPDTGGSRRYPALATLVLALTALGTPVEAQETRAGLIAARQAEKAAAAEAYVPSRFERIMARVEENLASPPNGLYPEIGRIYQGGGFTFGGGYRQFFSRRAVWETRALYSVKAYKLVEAGVRTPWNGSGRWSLDARGGWLDAPQVSFYGVGMGQSPGRSSFHLSKGYAVTSAEVQPTAWTRLRGELGYDAYQTKSGRGSRPSIETLYSPATVPGLFSDISFVRSEVAAAIDWRTSPGYSRRGGYYGVSLASYADREETYGFQRLEGELIQHLPVLRESWVLSFRGRVQSIVDDDDVVPYFLLPELGSGRTLRGYGTGRFRDRHSILTSAEFRWIPNRLALDMALFYDAGKVAARRADLDFENLKSNWGVGIRFHGPTTTALRVEAARGSEGWRLIFATSSAF